MSESFNPNINYQKKEFKTLPKLTDDDAIIEDYTYNGIEDFRELAKLHNVTTTYIQSLFENSGLL